MAHDGDSVATGGLARPVVKMGAVRFWFANIVQ